jgi:hypothetical protein
MSLRLSYEQRHKLGQLAKDSAFAPSRGFLLENGNTLADEEAREDTNSVAVAMYRASHDGIWTPTGEDIALLSRHRLDTLLVVTLKGQQVWLKAWKITPDDAYDVELLLPSQADNPARLPLTNAQIYAILILMLLTLLFFLFISFSLLPPASPIPTPRG